MAKLIDKSLRPFRLLHDALLVVLPDGAAELVVVHGRTVLAFTPQSSHTNRVFDFEDSLGAVQPTDARAVRLWVEQQLLQELPQMDVRM